MNSWIYLFLFVSGSALGSFLNVVSLRFDPERDKLFQNIYGRSHCPYCKKELQWYELIPFFSFALQLGKCRSCKTKLSLQYPLVELLCGLGFVFVTYKLFLIHPTLRLLLINQSIPVLYFLIAVWILTFLSLMLMSIIDFYHRIIPDSINIFIGILGLAVVGYKYFMPTDMTGGSFLGHYVLMFTFGNPLLNHLVGLFFGAVFLGALYVISRGRGMGFGDVKLATALGLLMGWPDIALALMLAFITGSILSLALIFLNRKTIKDYVPFGPFIAMGVFLVFFFGYDILHLYFAFFDSILPS